VQAPSSNGAPQTQNQQGQHPQGQGQAGHRRRRRRRNKGGQAKGQQNGAATQNGAPAAGSANGSPAPAPASQHPGHQKQKSGKRFFQKSPGNQGSYGGNGGFRPSPGNGNGNGGVRRKSKGRRQQVFVGPMDHSYRGGANGNVADPQTHSQNGDFRGMPHSGFYSETDYVQRVPVREDAPTRIYCFIEDLFILAKIQEVSKKLGIKVAFLKPEKDVVTKLTETREEDRPALILFDLNNANAKPLTLIPKIKAKLKRGTSVIGFLAHIQGELKSKAIEAGCDTVMPRSTFSQNLPSLLRRYGIVEEAEDEFQAIQA
jgi:CheY-like chemotaxis protein